MMTRSLENAFGVQGDGVRTLDDNARYDDDLRDWNEEKLAFKYPLYTRILPAKEMHTVQYACAILEHTWDDGQANPDQIDEAVRIVVTLYATWGYDTQARRDADAIIEDRDVDSFDCDRRRDDGNDGRNNEH